MSAVKGVARKTLSRLPDIDGKMMRSLRRAAARKAFTAKILRLRLKDTGIGS
jgi:hypothetical protein